LPTLLEWVEFSQDLTPVAAPTSLATPAKAVAVVNTVQGNPGLHLFDLSLYLQIAKQQRENVRMFDRFDQKWILHLGLSWIGIYVIGYITLNELKPY